VADLIEMLERAGYRIVLCYHPPDAQAQVAAWLGPKHPCLPQEGTDLGARMANAFKKAYQQDFQSAILIGTDFPDLPVTIIDQAFDGLQQRGAVIGPTYDGGYYLIGFERADFLPAVFEGIPWSTAKVFETTMQIFSRHRQRPFILPRWQDIDDFEDLMAFSQPESARPGSAPRTRALLRSLQLKRG
jgi:rSAM/selenodomain-associated transferase 1